MRFTALGLLLLTAAALPAQDADGARKVVEDSLAKIGGRDKLADLKSGVWKTGGVFQGKQSRGSFSGELPGRFRLDSTRIVNGQTVKSARIVDGDKGWTVLGDEVKPMTAEQVSNVKNSFYHKQNATTLLPLLEKECKLSKIGTVEVEMEECTVVKAEREGRPELLLFFSTKTGLLAKSQMTEKNEASGAERRVEIFYKEYKDFGGITMASRVKSLHDGKPFQEADIIEFKGSSQPLPGGTFAPPGK